MLKISITKLSNKNFVANAPENIVQEEQGRQDQAQLDIVNLKAQIEKLKSEQ